MRVHEDCNTRKKDNFLSKAFLRNASIQQHAKHGSLFYSVQAFPCICRERLLSSIINGESWHLDFTSHQFRKISSQMLFQCRECRANAVLNCLTKALAILPRDGLKTSPFGSLSL